MGFTPGHAAGSSGLRVGFRGRCSCGHAAALGELWRLTDDSLCVFHMRGIWGLVLGRRLTAVVVGVIGQTKKVSIREVCANGLISFISGLEVI